MPKRPNGQTSDPPAKQTLADLREEYARDALVESGVNASPLAQFEQWFGEARRAGIKEPNAMTLATASAEGRPSARIVLLKDADEDGFVFFTSYASRKGRELDGNPWAALTFYWPELERQVRIEGSVTRIARADSAAYFETRPKGHRLGAWASRQSEAIAGRGALEVRLKDLEARYAGTDDVPLPDFWGGYRVKPEMFEFWQGRPNRLHDRLRYNLDESGAWRLERLSP